MQNRLHTWTADHVHTVYPPGWHPPARKPIPATVFAPLLGFLYYVLVALCVGVIGICLGGLILWLVLTSFF